MENDPKKKNVLFRYGEESSFINVWFFQLIILDLIQKILASPERSGERPIRPNANTPQWGHQCNLLDNIRFPMERQ